MSTAIGTAQPAAPGPPRFKAKKMRAGATMPPTAAANGRLAGRNDVSSPNSTSRLSPSRRAGRRRPSGRLSPSAPATSRARTRRCRRSASYARSRGSSGPKASSRHECGDGRGQQHDAAGGLGPQKRVDRPPAPFRKARLRIPPVTPPAPPTLKVPCCRGQPRASRTRAGVPGRCRGGGVMTTGSRRTDASWFKVETGSGLVPLGLGRLRTGGTFGGSAPDGVRPGRGCVARRRGA